MIGHRIRRYFSKRVTYLLEWGSVSMMVVKSALNEKILSLAHYKNGEQVGVSTFEYF